METKNDINYSTYYREQAVNVYPTEWVIRAFLGKYPRLKLDRKAMQGQRILDLGFGDGRNFPLMHDLGLTIHGVEVTQDICDVITERMQQQGIAIEARAGRNSQIPYDDAYFDHLLSCSACYYMDEGQIYSDNVNEIARVLKPGGLFIHCLPMPTTFIMEDSVDTGDGHMRIAKDPYGVRVGALLKQFPDEAEVKRWLEPTFTDIRIGHCKADYWGDKVHLWFVVCTKK